ncbi:MAG: metallo-beta-lactamase family protein [Firmicutes bacterium]|nr:metallo-beta-lactamase family protein [Bacillota bacterium]
MRIITLAENTAISEKFGHEHGLSLYIETKQHKVLFDMGASSLFSKNAKLLDVDLSAVDVAIVSHGHYDHGGGLEAFLQLNSQAKVYLNQNAFAKYYANKPSGEKTFIGLDEKLSANDRVIFVENHVRIDSELELFSGVKQRGLAPAGNKDLLMLRGETLALDDFTHEQNLIITEGAHTLLLAGCAHNGIVNIIDHMLANGYGQPTHVIGGFHLYSRPTNQCEDPETIRQLGEYLMQTGATYYTCHCTGLEPYKQLRTVMGESIEYLAAGRQLIL